MGALPVGKSGVLLNRTATTYHLKDGYRQKQLEKFGVTVINQPVVIDKNIITSYCPQTAPYVAFELLNKLIDEKDTVLSKKSNGVLIFRKEILSIQHIKLKICLIKECRFMKNILNYIRKSA